jgi:hypothetical protein
MEDLEDRENKSESVASLVAPVVSDLQQLIHSARERVAVTINAEITLLYWRIGKRLLTESLKEKRANYGKQVIEAVAISLSSQFGKGFDRANLFRMIQFVEQFPDEEIVATLSRQLNWSHVKELLPLKDDLARTFYAEMCRLERWSVRTLRERINSLLYERRLSPKNQRILFARSYLP